MLVISVVTSVGIGIQDRVLHCSIGMGYGYRAVRISQVESWFSRFGFM